MVPASAFGNSFLQFSADIDEYKSSGESIFSFLDSLIIAEEAGEGLGLLSISPAALFLDLPVKASFVFERECSQVRRAICVPEDTRDVCKADSIWT